MDYKGEHSCRQRIETKETMYDPEIKYSMTRTDEFNGIHPAW
jgi:hypothetical protein